MKQYMYYSKEKKQHLCIKCRVSGSDKDLKRARNCRGTDLGKTRERNPFMVPLSIILFLIPKPVSLIAASGCHSGAGMSKGAAPALRKFSLSVNNM